MLQISSLSIQKLGHELAEIRVRTLKHIEGKITRAFQQNQHIQLNSGNLIKHLIRWFGIKPLLEEETVLNLMLTIFRSQHADEAIKYLGIERLKKEIGKIYDIVKSTNEKKNYVIMIKDILENYNLPDSCNQNDIISVNSTESSIELYSLSEAITEEFCTEYEIPWSSPSLRDCNSLKLLAESIAPECKKDEFDHGLFYLKTAINDYPAEYFLQPPYIFRSLLTLYLNKATPKAVILENLSYLTISIIGRIRRKITSETYYINQQENLIRNSRTQITIGRYCSDLFSACIEHLKDFQDNITPQELHLIFKLLFNLIDLLEIYSKISIPMKSILTDLSLIAKYYRMSLKTHTKPKRLNRLQYVLIIRVISKLIYHIQPSHTPPNSSNEALNKISIYNPNNYNGADLSYDLWITELEYALLDFPLQQFHAEQYQTILNSIKYYINDDLEILLNCAKNLKPAIKLLRQPDSYSNERFIISGHEALNTLSLHKSLEFVKKLIEIISQSIPLFDGNVQLKNYSEKIILRLLAHENFKIKRIAYKESANRMKYFFGSLMNGEKCLSKIYNSQVTRAITFGIPLTTEILSEIICFGYQNCDTSVKQNAEVMLSLIIKGRSILGKHWEHMLEILSPNFPLIQCLTNDTTNLGKLILNLFHPDTNTTVHNLIQTNLRFLFNSDEFVRSEALSRLIYILSNDLNGSDYLPNVLEISDTLSNDICVVTVPKNSEKIFSDGIYDVSTVKSLLALLKIDDIKPAIRQSTLVQLNIVCRDTELIDTISSENCWYLIIQAIENSLKKEPCADYPDTVIPAIGIISKLILYNPEYRRELSIEGNIYILLLRALFLFHQDITLQQDCSLALFLLLFSNYIMPVDGGKQISVPKILENLKLPIKCKYHWTTSPHTVITQLEDMFLKLSEQNQITSNNSDDENRSHQSSNSYTQPVCNENQYHGLEYIRMTFATNWFNSLDELLKSSRKIDSSTNLDYSLISTCSHNLNGNDDIINIPDVFKFNRNLELTKSDIKIIKYTSTIENIKSFLFYIENSTNVNNYTENLFSLQLALQLSDAQNLNLPSDIFLKIFRKYLINQPQNENELLIFKNVIKLFVTLIHLKDEIIIIWILENLQYEKQFMLLQLLKNYDLDICIYNIICEFFKELIKSCRNYTFHNIKINHLIQPELKIQSLNNNVDTIDTSINLYCKLFEYLVPIMEECFHKRYLNRVRAIVNLLQVITSSKRIEIDSGFMHIIAKKLLYFIMSLKSFTQAGSNLNKNCLLVILNLIDDNDEFILNENHIKFLSGFCSHPDFEIRALSWCLLAKIAENLHGAHLIIKELSFLPGGFHACCLSTLLDSNEVPIVRATAGGIFSNLLTHPGSNESNGIHLSVIPLCIEQEPSSFNNGIDLIKQIFNKHRFYKEIIESLKYFHISEIVHNMHQQLTTCEIVRTYCSIFINFVDLDSNLLDEFSEEVFLLQIFNLIRAVPSCISQRSLDMTSEICNLILRFQYCETKFLQRNLGQDQGYFVVLIHLLDLKYYENLNKTTLINILNVIKLFANDSNSYQLICEILSFNGSNRLIEILIYGISDSENHVLQNCCLKFITSLFIKSEEQIYKFETLPEILEKTILKDNSPSRRINDLDNRRRPRKRSLNENEEIYGIFGSEIIFQKLLILFDKTFLSKSRYKTKLLATKTIICETIAVFLKFSERARILANNINLLRLILTNIKLIFDNMSISCTDFIRKFGDNKKIPIVQELGILYGVILNWFSADTFKNEQDILEFCKICLLTWPWISHSENFRVIFIKCLAFLSEDSIEVCKQFSSSITNFGNSILQLIIKLVLSETNKVKHPQIDFNILELGLRILANCCSCIEGRLQIVKQNVLEIFNRFHPSVTKLQRTWNIITLLWLEFWQIFSRHPEGAALHHLVLLSTLVARANLKIRIRCIEVIRNLSFFPNNRYALLASQDFILMLTTKLSDGNDDEKLLISIITWKLIADNYKAKHTIKCTLVPRRLKSIRENLSTDNSKLAGVIEIILNILDT